MASTVNTGLVRVGVLLSIVWVIFIAGFVMMEGQRRNGLCAAAPQYGYCRHIFWAWETPPGAELTAAQQQEPPEEQLKRVLIKKLAQAIDNVKQREFRLQPGRILFALFGPLALCWSLGYGVAWCAAGFKPKK